MENQGEMAWSGPKHKGISPKNEPSAESVKVGEKIVVTIKRIGINGEGVGYYRKKAVFVHGALPDEVVKAKVTRTEPGYLTGEIIEIEKKSPQRKEPPCPIYYKCGGCQIQHMNYDAQLQAKEEIIRESFQRYTKLETLLIRPILPTWITRGDTGTKPSFKWGGKGRMSLPACMRWERIA
ncbi:TRAM domain-containing protein [Paenibacillus sp. JTLBN-2024]